MSPDIIKDIIEKANSLNNSEITNLKTEKILQRKHLEEVSNNINNILNLMLETKEAHLSMRKRLSELEKRQGELETDIHRIEAEINIGETQILNAHAMVNTLKNFSQIIDGAIEKEKKELLPLLIESVTFTPKEIKIALYDHFTEERFVNQFENDALELSNWLRW